MVSFRAGKNGYSLETALKLFNAALSDICKRQWSSGYLTNISLWKQVHSFFPLPFFVFIFVYFFLFHFIFYVFILIIIFYLFIFIFFFF